MLVYRHGILDCPISSLLGSPFLRRPPSTLTFIMYSDAEGASRPSPKGPFPKLYYNYYYPNPKYLNIEYMDPKP